MKNLVFVILGATCLSPALAQVKEKPIYEGAKYVVYPSGVVQGKYEAKADGRNAIRSTYESAANEFLSPKIDFKFSINGKDNEMPSGKDHHFVCRTAVTENETPLIKFGEQFNDNDPIPAGTYLQPGTPLKVRLDMRNVFSQFDSQGFFTTFNGARIYRNDLKGVYMAGGTSPLTWDFDNLHHFRNLELHDEDGDHVYELTLFLNQSADKKRTNPDWQLTTDVTAYPQYRSSFPLVDALYNLSLEEMNRAIEKDSTLRTGKEWAGVWTRDVSYSIILSMAILQNKVARYSLMRKVKDGMIIQDTGTGGAYPVSTDRMIWVVAAWEIYKVSGDREWLKTIYPIIKRSLEADLANAIDATTGLVKGESSFLDWREQTYPDWMEPADIYESQCLGTNAVHYQAHIVLARIAAELKDVQVAARHNGVAGKIKAAINEHLWLADKKYYGQFLYGRNFDLLSSKSEALGEALTILYDIADEVRQRQIVSATPVMEFGIPCIYPQIPNIPPYHNNAVWPFVQSYWTMAAAKAGNEKAVLHGLASIWRPAALFLTNKENFVASTGDHASTQINSDNMLWSLSGNIGMVYKVLFGIHYNTSSIVFKPFVPRVLGDTRTLKNFRYRNATLDITMTGYGNRINSILLDGKPLKNAEVPASLAGKHVIDIVLANNHVSSEINLSSHQISPVAPALLRDGSVIRWQRSGEGLSYKIFVNGKYVTMQSDTTFKLDANDFREYQVIAVDKIGNESFASEPLVVVPDDKVIRLEAEDFAPTLESSYNGFSGKGYVKTNLTGNTTLHFSLPVSENGVYAIDFRYANGNGPINTENKCAIRSLLIDGQLLSAVVLPQRGKDEWSDWGFTNVVIADLKSGEHEITLTYDQHNTNMNGEINEAVIDYIRLIRIN